jgi:hypothetical protein
MIASNYPSQKRTRYSAIGGCALIGSLSILILDLMILSCGVYYYSDDVNVLYPVAVHSLIGLKGNPTRPLEYLILLAANNLYLPLWLGASLLCVVGAAIVSALACERLLERELPKAGWWLLGLANPLLFYVVSQPDVVSQALCDLFFATALLSFITELYRPQGQATSSWRTDRVAFSLNLTSAALFFTKETAIAAAIVIPAVTVLIRFKAKRLSPIFLFSLFLPILAASAWLFLKLIVHPVILPTEAGRYSLKLNPLTWMQDFIVTLAFPLTPLPSSFLEFDLLRQLWVAVGLGSVILFVCFILRQAIWQPRIIVPLLVVVASCAPMILIHSSEDYPTMIAPFAVSIVLLFAITKMRRLTLAYGLLLYTASLANGIIYCLGTDFDLLGLQRLGYSIYGEGYQYYPICPIRTTARVGWDPTAQGELPFGPVFVKGRITCIQ